MFSGALKLPHGEQLEHLVVELKAPTVRIGQEQIAQVKKYASAVAADERFDKQKTKWEFWIVSNEIANDAQSDARQRGCPHGVVSDPDDNNVRIWVKTWGEILQECDGRLRFFRDNPNYIPEFDEAFARLAEAHKRLIPGIPVGVT